MIIQGVRLADMLRLKNQQIMLLKMLQFENWKKQKPVTPEKQLNQAVIIES